MGPFEGKTAPQLAAIMAREHAAPNIAQGMAWRWYSELLDLHRDSLRRHAAQLAERWPPEHNVAAAAYLSKLYELIRALDAVAADATVNGGALLAIADEISGTQKQLGRVAADRAGHAADNEDLTAKLNPFHENRVPADDERARQIMDAFNRASLDTYVRMQVPDEYVPPRLRPRDPDNAALPFDGGGGGGGWQPLSPVVNPSPVPPAVPAPAPVAAAYSPPVGPVGTPVGAGPVASTGPVVQSGAPIQPPPAPAPPAPAPVAPAPGPGPQAGPALPITGPVPLTSQGTERAAGPRKTGLLDNLPARRTVPAMLGGTAGPGSGSGAIQGARPAVSRPAGVVPAVLGETPKVTPPPPARQPATGPSPRPGRSGVIGGEAEEPGVRYSEVYEDEFWGRPVSAPAVITGPGEPAPGTEGGRS
ncbi:hypothetical protein [Longispora albida]|uniref:hypothetical protein n=1 Tax=Longispora albida TaxID=203523 RepID=UPI0003A837A0|nr:hypothetical protein [Longispora albida]